MRQFALFGAALLAIPDASSASSPDIRADTNRDGNAELAGDTDVAGKGFWSNTRGAIFLPNIGDSQRRCPN